MSRSQDTTYDVIGGKSGPDLRMVRVYHRNGTSTNQRNRMIYDGEPWTGMHSPQKCIFDKMLYVTLTFESMTLKT